MDRVKPPHLIGGAKNLFKTDQTKSLTTLNATDANSVECLNVEVQMIQLNKRKVRGLKLLRLK